MEHVALFFNLFAAGKTLDRQAGLRLAIDAKV
jgi:hypothetical protein